MPAYSYNRISVIGGKTLFLPLSTMAPTLPNNSRIGFDTIKFTLNFDPSPIKIEKTKYLRIVDDDGVIRKAAKFNEIPGKFGNHVIKYKHFDTRKTFEIECSPYGFRYGQNVFVGSNLLRTCRFVLKRMAKHFGFDETTTQNFINTPILLRRVDLVMNIELRDNHQVQETLKQINHQFVEHKQTTRYGTTAYFQASSGKDYVVVIYAKGNEMAAKYKANKNDRVWHRLCKESGDLLRIEVRIKAPELDRRHLNGISNWTPGKLKEMFLDYVSKLPMLETISASNAARHIDGLKGKLRQYYWLKLTQAPVEKLFSQRVIGERERELRKLGIDVKCRSASAHTPNLKKLLTSKTKVAHAKDWLIDAGRTPYKKRNRK